MITKSKKRAVVRSSRGSVLLIATLLCTSAGIRVVSSATSVWAADNPEVVQEEEQPAKQTGQSNMPLDAMDQMLKTLLEREKAVEEREKEVTAQLQKTEKNKLQIKEQLKRLEEAEEKLKATIALANTAAEDDLTRLTTVYENMKPKVAAQLFEEMDPDFAAGFLARMKPDSAASIMTGLSSQKAYSISVVLAGRNAETPTQ